MVTYVVESRISTKVVYQYYPENHTDSACGLISVQLENRKITLDKVAEEDFIYRISADELNEMRDTINEMCIEIGELPLTEEVMPTATEEKKWYYYADHVIRRLRDDIERGSIPDKGYVAWY